MVTNKLLAVESIRGIACLIVVFSHLSLTFFPILHSGNTDFQLYPFQSYLYDLPFGFLYSGLSAVFVFFVLSGFILTKVLTDNYSDTRLKKACLKRYPRPMLPALLSCVLAYLVISSFEMNHPSLTDWINTFGNFDGSLLGAFYNGAIDVFFLSGKSLYNPVLWTMKIELIGSFLVFLLIYLFNRFNKSYFSILLLFVILILTVTKMLNPLLGLGLAGFIIGFIFCIHGRIINFKYSILLLVTGLYLAGAHNGSSSYFIFTQIIGGKTYNLCNFISGILIVYAILFNNELNNFFSGKVGVFLGKISFSIYLIHLPILYVLGVYFFSYIYAVSENYTLASILASIVTITVSIILAIPFHKFVDKKAMTFSNWIVNRNSNLNKSSFKASKQSM